MENISDKTFFQLIPDEFREELNSISVDVNYPKDTILYMDGEKADNLYFIRTGSVKISKTTLEGKELTLYICKPGEMIGEIALFQPNLTYTATAEMIEDGSVGIIARSALEELLTKNSRLAVEFMKWMGIAYRRNQSKFRDLMLLGKHGALYSTLIRMTNTYGIKVKDGILIDLFLTNKDLANFIGTTRESVNRMLNELRKNEVISIDNGFITVHNITFLKEFLECDGCPEDICRI
ncbi:Crp/Fnr family transcriptional regulator [Ammoniphilus sp. YIM 78166]|uniref:Crp/Fnr family transcriptional regulator n=1 Tax=Ammoniphilus sp. YIM 78166 TaxID=1644106 RepID=UPI001F0F7585|nr:Crp/Fnr family transcriptional regulator [Ammoniphilus sp. YIM 78166]